MLWGHAACCGGAGAGPPVLKGSWGPCSFNVCNCMCGCPVSSDGAVGGRRPPATLVALRTQEAGRGIPGTPCSTAHWRYIRAEPRMDGWMDGSDAVTRCPSEQHGVRCTCALAVDTPDLLYQLPVWLADAPNLPNRRTQPLRRQPGSNTVSTLRESQASQADLHLHLRLRLRGCCRTFTVPCTKTFLLGFGRKTGTTLNGRGGCPERVPYASTNATHGSSILIILIRSNPQPTS